MQYTQEDKSYLQKAASASTSKHVRQLYLMIERNAPHPELFEYGAAYLPRLKDNATGKTDLEKLDGYTPEVVDFFDILSEIPSLPDRLKELAADLALYADGETVQVNRYYFKLDPFAEIKRALKEV